MKLFKSAKKPTGIETLSQWQLIHRRFRKHHLAVASMFLLIVMYLLAIFAEFFAPYTSMWKDVSYAYCPPARIPRISLETGLYVEAVRKHVNPITFQKTYIRDGEKTVPLGFFVKGEPYKLWGLIPWDRHFFGVDLGETQWAKEAELPRYYLLGADKYGRDIFSRIVYGARISLSIGIMAIVVLSYWA